MGEAKGASMKGVSAQAAGFDSGAPHWWPRPMLWLWRWLTRAVLRFLHALVGSL